MGFICLFETKCLQQMTAVMKSCTTVTTPSSMIHKSYVTYVQQKLQHIQNQLNCINILHVQCDSYEGQPAPVIPHCTVSRDFQICLCSSVSQIPVEPTSATMRWLTGRCWHGRNLANDALCIQLPPIPLHGVSQND
jgi:hypothetical protein